MPIMQNLDEILNYKKPAENYYTILGCSQSSTVSYRMKCLNVDQLQLPSSIIITKPLSRLNK